MAENIKTAVFGAGCFWCIQKPYDKLDGVKNTIVGYTGGHVHNPEYKQVSSGSTGHVEVVQVIYDAKRVSYAELLDIFWKNIDPFDPYGQFCDKGEQYQAVIFADGTEETAIAEASKKRIETHFSQPVSTIIRQAARFYPAEKYHQDYYKKNPLRYRYFRSRCGRDARLKEVWG